MSRCRCVNVCRCVPPVICVWCVCLVTTIPFPGSAQSTEAAPLQLLPENRGGKTTSESKYGVFPSLTHVGETSGARLGPSGGRRVVGRCSPRHSAARPPWRSQASHRGSQRCAGGNPSPRSSSQKSSSRATWGGFGFGGTSRGQRRGGAGPEPGGGRSPGGYLGAEGGEAASIRVSNLEVTEVRQGEPGTLDEVAGGEVVGRGLAFKQLVGRLALVDPGVCFLRLGG
ncbi:hypothetical protein mRhiFer1_008172 [Rhinolophus ferrumequinum]|uniref:Uncharacterized protein n=1 Tax=Rhinolophus ferrumequinum TaxID=59479 RepID=A0A7J7W7K5_RHIFE|nr:hypothetical protein mRhiFer1_008172 [Rhinolophus ferrumequinum]